MENGRAESVRDVKAAKSSYDKEEKHIINAWYKMGLALVEKPAAPGQPQSFLAQQRQSTQARRGLGPTTRPR